jgi:uncharacterized protein (DUF1330 family)
MSRKLDTSPAAIGIDIGKNSFHIVGQYQRGAIVLRQKWSRGQVIRQACSKRRRCDDMKSHFTLPATLVAGLMIGMVLTTVLRAQSMPPAYVVAEVAIHDTDAFTRDYAPKVAGTLEPYGGRFLTSGKLMTLAGNVPQRFVIIAFDSVEKARGWYDSPAYHSSCQFD